MRRGLRLAIRRGLHLLREEDPVAGKLDGPSMAGRKCGDLIKGERLRARDEREALIHQNEKAAPPDALFDRLN